MATSSSVPESKANNEIILSVKECPVVKVTVYKDRAEVCRSVVTSVKAGINEVKLQDMVEMDEDSIRVEGKGQATIAEVSFQTKYVSADEATMSKKEKELTDEVKALKDELKGLGLDSRRTLVMKQWKILDQFADAASTGAKGNKDGNSHLDDSYCKGMAGFLQHYSDIGKQLESERADIETKQKDLDHKIAVASANLDQLKGKRGQQTAKRECIIVLEAETEAKVSLQVSYLVFQASWYPTYDLRMSTDVGILKIFYYGLISNSSGEDWNNVKLHLSTAEPSVGGSIPQLPIQQLSIYKPRPPVCAQTFYAADDCSDEVYGEVATVRLKKASKGRRRRFGGSLRRRSNKPEEMPIARPSVQVSESTTSASFEIARMSTIPSDNTDHKVTVAVLELKPQTTYVTVPKVVPHAFLQAKVTNTSVYTMLAGSTNIFLDNSFVAKADLKAVAPKEEFECSLGVDPGVRVNYKPLVKVNSTTGLLSKWQSISYEQTIEVKNMHDYEVEVTVKDSLPRSMDEKIKVNLQVPHINEKHPEKGVRLTKNNHVEWDLNIAKLAKQEVVLKYTVEHPKNESTETNNVLASD